MRIGVIGASKGIGFEVVKQALLRRNEVKTLSRTNVNMNNEHLKQQLGDATKIEDVKIFLKELDAVIIALGRGKNTSKTTLFSDFANVLAEITKEQPINIPFIVLTGFGAGDSRKYLPFPANLVFKFILNKVYADKDTMERILINLPLKWEIVRPGMLTNGNLTEKYSIYTVLSKKMSMNKISRKDVANFMVKQAENPTLLGEYVTLMG